MEQGGPPDWKQLKKQFRPKELAELFALSMDDEYDFLVFRRDGSGGPPVMTAKPLEAGLPSWLTTECYGSADFGNQTGTEHIPGP